jgi:hypothetical protein
MSSGGANALLATACNCVLFVVEWWHKQFQVCVSGFALFMIF